jgi:type IV secretory pathway TrbF-like protein
LIIQKVYPKWEWEQQMWIKNKDNKTTNTYLNQLEEDGWNDIRAYHIASESAWRIVAILAIITLAVVAVYAMYVVNLDKHKTLIFEKDSQGNITTLGLASKTFNVDNKIIAHQLANFILALREVPREPTLKRRNIDQVHKMIDSKIRERVDQLLINQYTGAVDKQIMVQIKSIVPLKEGKSWSLHWLEETQGSNGEVIKQQNFSTIVTFVQASSVDPVIQLANPIGLFITYVYPAQDIQNPWN